MLLLRSSKSTLTVSHRRVTADGAKYRRATLIYVPRESACCVTSVAPSEVFTGACFQQLFETRCPPDLCSGTLISVCVMWPPCATACRPPLPRALSHTYLNKKVAVVRRNDYFVTNSRYAFYVFPVIWRLRRRTSAGTGMDSIWRRREAPEGALRPLLERYIRCNKAGPLEEAFKLAGAGIALARDKRQGLCLLPLAFNASGHGTEGLHLLRQLRLHIFRQPGDTGVLHLAGRVS
eukprot:scaffold7387_cov408-Prasinococcus_capsulatus_cf.AAC.2